MLSSLHRSLALSCRATVAPFIAVGQLCRGLSAAAATSTTTSAPAEVVAAPRPTPTPALQPGQWTPSTVRTGLIARKIGMMNQFTLWGERIPVTVLQIPGLLQVTQVKTTETDGYTALQLGCGIEKLKNVTKPLLGHFNKANVDPKHKLAEFRVSDDAILPVGWTLSPLHFTPGQLIDVTGTTKGRGFTGVMKRWNFAGGKASHGNSVSHRVHGSTGNRQDPGKVWKGKKMAGHYGVERVTTQNLWLYKVDTKQNLLYVKGAIPGNSGSYVLVKDAVKARIFESDEKVRPPTPTHIASADGTSTVFIADVGPDPFADE